MRVAGVPDRPLLIDSERARADVHSQYDDWLFQPRTKKRLHFFAGD
jgi:hypothetical protein